MTTKELCICYGYLCNGEVHTADEMLSKNRCKNCIYSLRKENGRPYQVFKNQYKYCHKCEKCMCSDVRLLEFDHVGEKNFDISHSFSRAKIAKEVENTQILCIWCHRIKSYEQNNGSTFNNRFPILSDSKNSLICNGPICNGKFRHKDHFYLNNNICIDCSNYKQWNIRQTNKQYIIGRKLEIGQCQHCYRSVTKQTHMCFDFDHIDKDTKIASVSSLSNCYILDILEKIKQELQKCQLLCCFCHKIRTTIQLGYNYSFKIGNNKLTFPIKQCNKCRNDTGYEDIDICINCTANFDLNIDLQLYKQRTLNCLKCNETMFKPTVNNLCISCHNKKYNPKCINCEKPIFKGSQMCDPCRKIANRKINRPTLKQLYIHVEEYGYIGTGIKYGVSDNSIRKWFKAYGVKPPRFYKSRKLKISTPNIKIKPNIIKI